MAKGDRTIFDIIKRQEEKEPRSFHVFWINPDDVPRIAREIRDSIPVLRSGDQAFEWDMKSALRGGKIRIGRTTLKVKQ